MSTCSACQLLQVSWRSLTDERCQLCHLKFVWGQLLIMGGRRTSTMPMYTQTTTSHCHGAFLLRAATTCTDGDGSTTCGVNGRCAGNGTTDTTSWFKCDCTFDGFPYWDATVRDCVGEAMRDVCQLAHQCMHDRNVTLSTYISYLQQSCPDSGRRSYSSQQDSTPAIFTFTIRRARAPHAGS